ncbi:UNVERIFIED_CONTAM: hypothetical protein FKN15_037653 [Acipenser sinensis]
MSCEARVSRFGSRSARQIASGEPPVPAPYQALTGRMCQWRTTHTRTVPSPHRSDVPVENHPYPHRTEPSQVGCASGEPPVPAPYRALTGRMCQWRREKDEKPGCKIADKHLQKAFSLPLLHEENSVLLCCDIPNPYYQWVSGQVSVFVLLRPVPDTLL